jgi:hypothetical protein
MYKQKVIHFFCCLGSPLFAFGFGLAAACELALLRCEMGTGFQ